jgi:hypothetical protein
MVICSKNVQRAKIVIGDTVIEEVADFMYLGNMISEFKTYITIRIHQYNKINYTIKRYFVKNMLPNTKLRLYNITSKATLKYGSELINFIAFQ